MSRRRFHLLTGLAFVILFVTTSWLITGRSSPCHEYFLWHVELPNLYRRLHTGPYVAGMLISGNVHQPSSVGFFAAAALQWFVMGFLLSFICKRFNPTRHEGKGQPRHRAERRCTTTLGDPDTSGCPPR